MSHPLGKLVAMIEIDKEILAFERLWFRHPSAKEQAIRERFDLPAVAYHQRLARLLDDEAAVLADPQLVARLRRQRSGQRQLRAARAA